MLSGGALVPLLLVSASGAVQLSAQERAGQDSVARTPEERAGVIVAEAARRVAGYGDFTATLTVSMREADGDERERTLRISSLEVPGDGTKTLAVFERPRDVQGVSVLTITHRDARTEQWLYLPAVRRVRRVASSSQADSFLGSEFTYEDLGSFEFHKYRHRYLREEAVDGRPAHVLERVPIDAASAYGRQVLWLDASEYRVVAVDYYDRSGALEKSLEVGAYREQTGGQWRPGRMVMVNRLTGASTELRWSEYAFRTGLTDADFDPRRLGRAR